jgi:hypothetical protein
MELYFFYGPQLREKVHGFVLNFSHMVQYQRIFFSQKVLKIWGIYENIRVLQLFRFSMCYNSTFTLKGCFHYLQATMHDNTLKLIVFRVLKHYQDEYICILNKMIFLYFFEKKIKNF